MKNQDYFSARKIKTSPSGRVPKWVLDEAAGRTVEVVPFRGATAGLSPTPAPRRGRARTRPWLVAIAVVGVCGLALLFDRGAIGPSVGVSSVAASSATESAPPAGHEERAAPLGAPPAVVDLLEGGGYRFTRHQQDSKAPVTWSPCRPIHYVVRASGQPVAAADILRAAIGEASRATGLRFIDDGPTDEGPAEDRSAYQPDRYGQRWAPVLIAWATSDEVPDFGTDIDGEAGPSGVRTSSGDMTYVSGTVYLDPVKIGSMAGSQGYTAAQSVIMHELGHLLGLAHVSDASQVMFARGLHPAAYGIGDRAGLAQLGRGACQPDA